MQRKLQIQIQPLLDLQQSRPFELKFEPAGGVCEGWSEDNSTGSGGRNLKPYPAFGFWGDPDSVDRFDFRECEDGLCQGGIDFKCGSLLIADMGKNRMCMTVEEGNTWIAGFKIACPGADTHPLPSLENLLKPT